MPNQLEEELRSALTALGPAAVTGGVPPRQVLLAPAAWLERLKQERPAETARDQVWERALLLRAALESLPELLSLRLPPVVERKWGEAMVSLRRPEPAAALEHPWFPHWAAVATLRRFPAGQLDYVIDGFPRSWTWRAPRRDWLGLAAVLWGMGGFRPCYFTHVGLRRPSRFSLTENEANRSYWLVAQALKLHPEVRGLITASWFHAPDTFRVSPHLEWFNKTPQAGGAFFTVSGPAPLDSGVFERSPERKKLYEEGKFEPMTGVMVWPRAELIAWAERNPEAGQV